MKKIFVLFAMTAIIAACSKENVPVIQDSDDNTVIPGKEMLLFAEIPTMTDATKATADGAFSWAEDDEIAVPISSGYVIFTFDEAKDAFTYTPSGSETFVDGTAYYPASSCPGGSYSTAFADAAAARAGFKMEADYTVGSSSLSFTHKSSLIKLNFENVPSFATSVRVKAGDDVVATVALSNPDSSVEVKVPVTPNGKKTYSFALMEGDNVLKEVSKTDVTLATGTFYSTPDITVKYIKVGVRDHIYNDWNLKTGWKIRYWKGETTGDAVLVPLGTTEEKSISGYYEPGTYYLYYSVSVPTDNIDGFKVWCDNGTNENWFGNDASPSITKVYVFEWDYGSQKLAYYE